jgi:hypothetical protein
MAASSSGLGLPPVDAGAGVTDAVPATFDAKLASMQGIVYLDRVGEFNFILTNIVTHERVELPRGCWELIFDDTDIVACLVVTPPDDCDAEPEPRLTNMYLKKDVYISDKGERYAVTHPSSEGRLQSYSIDFALTKHVESDVEVRVGVTSASAKLPLVVMQLPRAGGARVYWSLSEIYTFMGLRTYKGVSSKWIWESRTSWAKRCEDYFGHEAMLYSKHGNVSDKRVDEVQWYDRCLTAVSMSTPGLLLVTCRWCMLPRESGGFDNADSRSAACMLLSSAMGEALAFKLGLTCTISLDAEWKNLWPRPSHGLFRCADIMLVVDWQGNLDLEPLYNAQVAHNAAKQWLRSLWKCGLPSRQRFIPLMKFLEIAICAKQCRALVAQILVALASQLELCFAAQGQKKFTSTARQMLFSMRNLEDQMGGNSMSYKLAQYVYLGAESCRHHLFMTIATDKASPAMLSLSNAIIVYPDNTGVLCCPQVLRTTKRHFDMREPSSLPHQGPIEASL